MSTAPAAGLDPNRRFLAQFKPVLPGLVTGVLLAVAQALVLLKVPQLFKDILDVQLPQRNFNGLLMDAGLVLGLFLVNLAVLVGSRYLVLKTTKHVVMRLRADVVLKLQHLSISFYDSEDLGQLHSRIIQDTEKVDVMANFIVSVLMTSAVRGLGALCILWFMNWKLTALLLVVALAFWALQEFFKKKIKVRYRLWRSEFDSFSAKVQVLLHSIRLVRAFTTEERESEHMTETAVSLSHRGVVMVTYMALFNGLVELLTGVSMVVVLLGGGWLYLQGQISVGVLVAFFTTLGYVFGPLGAILNNIDQLFGGQVALGQIYELLDHPDIEPERADGLVKPLAGRVELRHVGFSYPKGQPALVDANVQVKPGQTVALVGASGAGKSTFVSLLLGFYRPSAGQVLIDDVPLEQYQTKGLREQMAVVAQDNVLLAGSIRSNIRYGRPEATERELEQACRIACAWDFIRELPQGMETEVGERGVKLSGGQKQRLAIARALLRDPRILILDEATSALDSLSEQSFRQALENLRADRTTFVIAHRLSTVKNADLLLVFDKGSIVERGTHQELLEKRGAYSKLFGAQWEAV
ncbi:MAG TPA: ABC transporter ATP-binding protein [bacterium]|nr:ABC transporter ATP-binding protein [bacterium]